MTKITLSRALNEGLRRSLENDPKVMIMGEDVGRLGGVFRVTDGLQKDFGKHRVVDTPLAESGIVADDGKHRELTRSHHRPRLRGGEVREHGELRAACLALPDPPPLALFDHVYADPNAILDAERAQFAAYLAGFEEEGAER